jgi:hypothetical protein
MTEIILQPICSNTIPDYQTSEVLNETAELLLELNQVPQIPHISNRLNKKRKKNSLSKSEGGSQKKTKVNQDDDIDIDINVNDQDIESLSFSTINTDVVMKQVFIASETGDINTNSIKIWYNNLNKVKDYIDKNDKTPSNHDKNKEIKSLGKWINSQKTKYIKKEGIMNNEDIYTKWANFVNEYQKYFLSNEKIWYNSLNKVKEYIVENSKKPSHGSKIKDIQILGSWVGTQQQNYKTKEQIMKNDEIYNEWTQFMNEYEEYLKSNEEIWFDNLNKVKDYINLNKKKPTESDEDKEIHKLGKWLSHQQINYKKREYNMKDKSIYSEWTQFMKKYKEYFLSNKEIWYDNLNKVKEYIDYNKKRPNSKDKDLEINQLAQWLCHQPRNYKKKQYNMKDDEIYNNWSQFMNEYKEYFLSDEEIWYDNLNKVKEYIDNNKKRPSQKDKNKEIKQLGWWINTQQQNYKTKEKNMSNDNIYSDWTNFINKYQEYFKSNEKSNDEIWYDNLNKVKEYIDNNKKRPSNSDKNIEIKQLATWLRYQNIKKKEEIMTNEKIYKEWTNFINDYEKYFLSNEEIWYDNLNKVKEYIDNNKKRPSNSDKNIEIKHLGQWLSHQQKIFKKKEYIMKDDKIYNEWTQFLEQYQEYFN